VSAEDSSVDLSKEGKPKDEEEEKEVEKEDGDKSDKKDKKKKKKAAKEVRLTDTEAEVTAPHYEQIHHTHDHYTYYSHFTLHNDRRTSASG
jgi:hypothetical protein